MKIYTLTNIPEFQDVPPKERIEIIEATERILPSAQKRKHRFFIKSAFAITAVPAMLLVIFFPGIHWILKIFLCAISLTLGVFSMGIASAHNIYTRYNSTLVEELTRFDEKAVKARKAQSK